MWEQIVKIFKKIYYKMDEIHSYLIDQWWYWVCLFGFIAYSLFTTPGVW